MADVTAQMVKDLRETTGAGMMDCKKALSETAGDMEQAIDWLRKKGLSQAAKKSGRVAAEGLVGVAIEGNAGAVLEVGQDGAVLFDFNHPLAGQAVRFEVHVIGVL